MSNIETGGPAFPGLPEGWNADGTVRAYGGMDLRDYFAAKALQALIGVYEPKSDEGCIPDCAESAYLYADAMLLASNTGRQVSEFMLSERWTAAKEAAMRVNPKIAADLRGLYLRDLRKRAANLADDMAGASKLLQHSSEKLTADHYRTKPVKLLAVR